MQSAPAFFFLILPQKSALIEVTEWLDPDRIEKLLSLLMEHDISSLKLLRCTAKDELRKVRHTHSQFTRLKHFVIAKQGSRQSGKWLSCLLTCVADRPLQVVKSVGMWTALSNALQQTNEPQFAAGLADVVMDDADEAGSHPEGTGGGCGDCKVTGPCGDALTASTKKAGPG